MTTCRTNTSMRATSGKAQLTDNYRLYGLLKELIFWQKIAGHSNSQRHPYLHAASVINKLKEPLQLLYNNGRLHETLNSTAAVENAVAAWIVSGRFAPLETMRAAFPKSLLDLYALPGMKIKTIKHLYQHLGIDSCAALRHACERHEIAEHRDYGQAQQAHFLKALNFWEAQQGRYLIHNAWIQSDKLYRHLATYTEITHLAVTGELRRSMETISEIALLAAARNRKALLNHYHSYHPSLRILAVEENSSLVLTESDIPARLEVIGDEAWPFALLQRSSSDKHFEMLQGRASERGLVLTRQELRRSDGSRIPCTNEEEIYEALGMPFIPPELREGDWEFSLKATPDLITKKDLKGIIHCHSTWSDGKDSLEELALEAETQGYSYIVITDHSQNSVLSQGMPIEKAYAQQREIDALNSRLTKIRIIKGIEADILEDGSLDYGTEVLSRFEFVIASIHQAPEMTVDEATKRLIKAIEHPHTDVIGHMTGRLLLSRPGYAVHVDKVVDAAVANGVALEINGNPNRLDMDWRHLYKAADKGAIFSIGPDAHRSEGLINVYFGLGIARKGGLTSECIVNCKSAEEIMRWRKRK
ncbi:MAG: PHP domain-containing protein [Candidatus Hydrogenedentales bacterium]|jgi:DNA polymerase (family 10)